MGFFNGQTAKSLWQAVIGVSPAGRRRGRNTGLGRAVIKDFNRGQKIGEGKKKLVLGGLNTRVNVGSKVTDVEDAGENENYLEELRDVRKKLDAYRKRRDHPMQRGWSGRKMRGKHAGPPDPKDDIPFENFKSIIIESRMRIYMDSLFGRSKKQIVTVVCGNGNGLAGFGKASGKDPRNVVRQARNKAGQFMVHVPRFDNHTVLHDFFSRYYFTTVFVQRMPKGYGVRATRVIQAACECFGITDIRATVQGSDIRYNVLKAFFLGLINQKKYQDIANEKQLHLVETRDEHYNYPTVLASPEGEVLNESSLKVDEGELDFTYYIYQNRIKQVLPPIKNQFIDTPGWQRHLQLQDYTKNRYMTRLNMAAKYGDARVNDVFPYFRCNAESFKEKNEEEAS